MSSQITMYLATDQNWNALRFAHGHPLTFACLWIISKNILSRFMAFLKQKGQDVVGRTELTSPIFFNSTQHVIGIEV